MAYGELDGVAEMRKNRYRPRLAMIVVPSVLFFISVFLTLTLSVQIQISLVVKHCKMERTATAL